MRSLNVVIIGLIAASVVIAGYAWLETRPSAGSTSGSPQAAPLPLVLAPTNASSMSNIAGCTAASPPIGDSCFVLFLLANTTYSTTNVSSLTDQAPNGTTTPLEVTLATSCVTARASNGSILSIDCQLGIAHLGYTAGWANCTLAICGGANTTKFQAPPAELGAGVAFVVALTPAQTMDRGQSSVLVHVSNSVESFAFAS